MPAGPVGTCWAVGSWSDTVWEENTWEDQGEGPIVAGGMRQMLMGIGCWALILIQVSGTALLGLDYSQMAVETRQIESWQRVRKTQKFRKPLSPIPHENS